MVLFFWVLFFAYLSEEWQQKIPVNPLLLMVLRVCLLCLRPFFHWVSFWLYTQEAFTLRLCLLVMGSALRDVPLFWEHGGAHIRTKMDEPHSAQRIYPFFFGVGCLFGALDRLDFSIHRLCTQWFCVGALFPFS